MKKAALLRELEAGFALQLALWDRNKYHPEMPADQEDPPAGR
jgi:hypothetical protein